MEIHVSPGMVPSAGSAQVVATVLEARDAARQHIAAGLSEPLTITLVAGVCAPPHRADRSGPRG